jgi:hypothetical protein
VTVAKDTANSGNGYEVYKITLDDSYHFDEGGFQLRLIDGEGNTEEPYIGITCDGSGLNVLWADWDESQGGFYYRTQNDLSKTMDIEAKRNQVVYFVNKSETDTTRCTTAPTVQTLAGAAVDSSVVTITAHTEETNDAEGLYDVQFNQTGTYRIVGSDGTCVIARVNLPDVGLYKSKTIDVANLIGDDTYQYPEGKSIYLAIATDTEGGTFTWDEEKNKEVLEKYGLTVKKVSSGTAGYDIYQVSMSLGYIVNNEWFELLIPYTPNSEDDGDAWDYSVGFSSECQIAAGSLVVSWGNPNEENEEHCKNMGVNDQHNWLYLSKAALNTSTGEYTYIPVKNISDIKIVSQDSSNPLTISETDADAGYYLFAFEKGNESGTYLIKVGNSYVGIEKSPEIVSAYVADGKTNLTEKEYYYALDTASAADDDDRTFYVSFSKANLGEENSFYDFYVGNRSDEEGNGTAGEYYYFADSSLNDSETDWAGNTIKKLTSDDVAVEVQSNDENGVVLKITVSENAPANLSFHVGTIVKNNEEDLDPKNPWIEEKYILVTNVSTAVDKDSKSLDTKAVDNGNVTITDVPSIADLDLETNLGDAATLSGDEAASAKKVEISIRTDVIEQKDDKFKEILSDSYSATFLDLSVKATVTKAATNDNGNVTAGASVTVPITRTNQPFTIKVPIPTNLQAKKGFSIIRYHEGKTEKLEATIVYENGKPSYLEFKTDRFSTYALAYREATAVDNLNFNDATWEVTGDNTFSYDGTGKTLNIEISGMPEGCTYTLKGTTATAEGSYTVYVDKITYGGKEYAASDVELPSVIAKGYTWSILDANLTAVSDTDTGQDTGQDGRCHRQEG